MSAIGMLRAKMSAKGVPTTTENYTDDNLRFNHGFEVFNVCCDPRSILKPDDGGH